MSDDETSFLGVLESGRWWAALAFFFVAGIALAFTPCVLPMVPILSAVIVGDRHRRSKKRALLLTLAYVLGMSVTYASIGVVAALSGQLVAASLQNAWVLWTFAAVFVVLALSMFGFFHLQLPAGLRQRLHLLLHSPPLPPT